MKSYRKTMPPLDALVFFEAAARHMNFSKAAEELWVTQTAVSKRMKQLEDFLGVLLFQRNGRSLALTESGQQLQDQSIILLEYADTMLAGLREHARGPVRIAANSSVSLFWLAPRLKAFGLSESACPVEMLTSDHPDSLIDTLNDLVILHGDGKWEGFEATPLFPDELVPVVSKELAEGLGLERSTRMSSIAPDFRPPLLDYALFSPRWTNWRNWQGLSDPESWKIIVCQTYAQSIGRAMKGEGIALGNPHILEGEFSSGRLVPLCPAVISGAHGYYLAQAVARGDNDNVRRLVQVLGE